MTGHTTLARRGKGLADGPNIRDLFKKIMDNLYDPIKNPNGIINIGVAENFAMLPDVCSFINNDLKLVPKDFSYGEGPWGKEMLRKAMAKHMTKTFNAIEPVDHENLLFANGVTSICEMLGFTLCDPGDGVLFGTPIYQAFQIDFETKAKVQSVFADFTGVDQFSLSGISRYEDAIIKAEKSGVKVRAMMLCNPHNPLGQCYPKATIIAIMKLCDKYKLHLLCDEIYASSVYHIPDSQTEPFTSVLSFDYSKYIHPDYVHVIYGMSKDFGCGGIRLGCILLRNKELMRAMSALTQFHWSGNVNEQIAIKILEDEEWLSGFLGRSRALLSERNQLTRKLLDDAGIAYHRGANAGFFIWIDLRPYLPSAKDYRTQWEREQALVQGLLENGVFITNGEGLHATEAGWFRIIFSQDEALIKEGVRRVLKTIGK